MTDRQKANNIVNLIVDDISDRRGLKWEWEKIDDDVKSEIKKVWRDIIMREIAIL